MAGGPPPGMPPMGPPPGMGGPPGPGGPGGPEGGVTVEDLLSALKQLPEPLLRELVAELQSFLGPEGAGAGPPEMADMGPPPGALKQAAAARAGV